MQLNSSGISHLHIGKFKPRRDLVLPEELREILSNPFGEIFNVNDIPKQLSGKELVISVGDETTDNLLKLHIKPDLAIFDLQIERKPVIKLRLLNAYKQRKIVSNPPGKITIELWNAVAEALSNRDVDAIQVDGEEDLAALVCGYLAPDNSVLLYGMPSKGVCIVKINKESRKLAERILREMAK